MTSTKLLSRRSPLACHAPRLVLAATLACLAAPPVSTAKGLPVEELVLDNGMKVLFYRRTGDPVVACGWVAKVGSVNERPGITGISHLFEHMMFKGTRTIGTKDIEADLALMKEMDATRAEIRKEQEALEWKQRRGEIEDASSPNVRTERHAQLLEQYAKQLEREKELLEANEYDKIFQSQGSSGTNAGTSHDWTFYFVTLPSNKLNLWFWMESDRLREPVFRQFYSERDVVWEERRMRTDSTPTGKLDEQFEAMFWRASPYSWPVVGWPSDLDAITREDAEGYFDRNYSPNNLTGALVGDFDVEWAKALAQAYFGRLKRSPHEPTAVRTFEPPQVGEQRLEAEAETKPTVTVRWPTVPYGHVDEAALSVLSDLLNGTTGRLQRILVEERKICTSASAQADQRKYAGYFEVQGVAAPGHDTAEVEDAIHSLLSGLQEDLVGERELQKVKNGAAASNYRRLSSNFFVMVQLLLYDAARDWRDMETEIEKQLAVTPERVRDVAVKYFRPEARNVAVYRTKKATGPPDPAWEKLTADQRNIATQIKAQLAAVEDAAKLEASLAQISASKEAAPEEMKPVLAWAETYVQAKLESLKGASK
jgi:predicted Zn-dependent peptidase